MTDDEIRAALKAKHACCSKREVAAVRAIITSLEVKADAKTFHPQPDAHSYTRGWCR